MTDVRIWAHVGILCEQRGSGWSGMRRRSQVSRARRAQISDEAHQVYSLSRIRGLTVNQIQDELLASFPDELEPGEARMYAEGWNVRVVREGLRGQATEQGQDASALEDADVWRWLRGEVYPRDSLMNLCRLFRCHQAKLGWPARGNERPIDFTPQVERAAAPQSATRRTRFTR